MKPDSDCHEKSDLEISAADRPDDWLIREWKKGNEQAAKVFYDRYSIRLVALVASRLNRRFRGTIDPEEVVQSALGSFFSAARHGQIRVSGSVSLWRLLATFARRKMARSIERQSAQKRGGGLKKHSLNENLESPSLDDESANEFLDLLRDALPEESASIVEGLLAGATQAELARSLGIEERTVRRRLTDVREQLIGIVNESAISAQASSLSDFTQNLPIIRYHEFVLGRMLGSGGFGKVYRASLQSDGQIVAVKFLRKAFWQIGSVRESFLREVDTAFLIDHPGVIRYLGVGESPHGGPYVLSEWLDGSTLGGVGKVGIAQFRTWLIQVCQALEVVHDEGLVHGDLTPENILIDEHGRAKITDFGLSQAFIGPTAPQLLGGTIGFAAPEQIDFSFGTIGPRTDVYAIGGLVHWFLFGSPPRPTASIPVALAETVSALEFSEFTSKSIPDDFRIILNGTLRSAPSERTLRLPEVIRLLADTRA